MTEFKERFEELTADIHRILSHLYDDDADGEYND